MMFEPLVAYARNLDGVEAGFASKNVRWAILLGEQGQFLGTAELGDADKKKNPGLVFPKCPDLSQPELVKGGKTRSHFLTDSLSVVALLGASDDPKILLKHAYFIELLEKAGDSLPLFRLMHDFLSKPENMEAIRDQLKERKAKPPDKITFRIGKIFPLETNLWHEWWRNFRKELSSKGNAENDNKLSGRTAKKTPIMLTPCFVTGELVEPLRTQPKISGLADVGGQAFGCTLIGFDKEAFCSFGFDQSANAAISEEGANLYRAALDALIRENSRKLAGAKVVFWFKEKVSEGDDPLPWLIEGKDRQERDALQLAKDLLQDIRTGKKTDLGGNCFYALSMSGSGGRVMVRDWMEGSFEELAENTQTWFEDLSIVHRQGGTLAKSPKFLAVAGSTTRNLDDLPAPFVSSLWRVAVKGTHVPRSALAQALMRARVNFLEDKPAMHAGLGLIKAYHIRMARKNGGDLMNDFSPYLNENHPHPAYHCGRLMAMLAGLQRSALGDVGAGIVQRYYAATSTTPALVLGRLTKTSQFHLNKLSPRLAYWYEGKIADIWARIEDSLPATLDLEEQSLFALGYYQQIAANRHKESNEVSPDDEETINE